MQIHKKMTALLLCLAAVSHADFKLAENGQAAVTLETGKNAPEQLAERELRDSLRKVTGSPVKKNGKIIRIGTAQELPGLNSELKKQLAEAKNDAFTFQIADDRILIAGNCPRAALFGTYAFIEKHLGVRWFFPGRLGEHYPVRKDITIPNGEFFQEASFRYRELSVCGTSTDFISTYDWMARNRMNINPGLWQMPRFTQEQKERYRRERGAFSAAGGHEGMRRVIPGALLKEHPEYFALKNGKRAAEGRVNRCLAHPEVQKRMADYYIGLLRKAPETVIDFIGEDDSSAFCECAACRKMGTYNGRFSISTLFHRYCKSVGDRILKEFPKAHLRFWAYWNYRNLPEDPAIRYESENSHLLYAAHQKCYVHDFSEKTVCNRELYKEMLEWKKRCPSFGIYDYRHDARSYYAPFEFVLADDLKTLRGNGALIWLDEITPAYGTYPQKNAYTNYASDTFLSEWQTIYTAAKLLWDTSLDVNDLLAEAYDIYYGKAAPVMKKYHDFRKQLWENAPGHSILNGQNRSAFCLNVPGAEEKLLEMLKQAEDTAEDALVCERIALDRRLLREFWQEPAAELRKQLAAKKELIPEKRIGKIVIDGRFDEQTWLKAQPAGGFLESRHKQPARAKTEVRVAYDEDNLYFAVNADESLAWRLPAAAAKALDDPVWEDDSIEIQIAPGNDSGKYYHLIINTAGVLYDASGIAQSFDKSFTSDAEVKVLRNGSVRQYEIRVPLAPMGAKIEPGKVWRMHFMRSVTNLQPPDEREWSSMDGVPPHQVQLFRNAVFSKNHIVNGNFAELSKQKIGRQEVMFPKKWELYGNTKDWKIIKTGKGNEIYTKGVLTTGIPVPKDLEEGSFYNLVIRAKGTGKIGIRTWSWEGHNPRTNHRRVEDLPKYDLSDTYKDYTFRIPYLPKEYYQIFYIDGNDKTIENVSCTVAK